MDEGLRQKHPSLFHAMQESTYQQALAKLSSDLSQLNDDEITVRLMRLVAGIRDGHAGVKVEFRDGLTRVPLRINLFKDGLYIRAALQTNSELVGARITAIGGVPWRDAVQQVKELISCDPDNASL
jgi:hypothetical protein